MLLPDIGFERDWVRAKIDSGVRFRLVLFALGDCSRVFTPTWDGLLSFIESECPACAAKARPHVDAMRQLSFAELVQLGNTVDNWGDASNPFYGGGVSAPDMRQPHADEAWRIGVALELHSQSAVVVPHSLSQRPPKKVRLSTTSPVLGASCRSRMR